MASMNTYEAICNQQKAWAARRKIAFDEHGYVFSITDNLFLPLLPQVADMLSKGSGNELGIGKSRGKLSALHSSAALVLNVFQYWFNKDVGSIAEACGASAGMKEMHFERTHPTPLGGVPPHIDVEFCTRGLRPLAIESKYTETYHFHNKRQIRNRYLTRRELWDGLPRKLHYPGRRTQETSGARQKALSRVS